VGGELLHASGIAEIVSVDVHSAQAAEVVGLPLTLIVTSRAAGRRAARRMVGGGLVCRADEGAVERASAIAKATGVDGRSCGRASAARRAESSISDWLARRAVGRSSSTTSSTPATRSYPAVGRCAGRRHGYRHHRDPRPVHGGRWRALLAEGVQEIVITDTVLSRRRPAQAQVAPVAPLLAAVLEGRRHLRRV